MRITPAHRFCQPNQMRELTVAAARTTCAANSESREARKRPAGADIPIDATTAPLRSRIGAAIQQTSSIYSEWSMANPRVRISAQVFAYFVMLVSVFLV